jgi:site-specific recombinase XerD
MATRIEPIPAEEPSGGEIVPDGALAAIQPESVAPSEFYLARGHDVPGDQNPATVYLASLGSAKSRRVILSDLNKIAALVTSGREDAYTLDWGALRFSHTAAIRAALAERYTHSGANRMLSALRGVLKASWRLGQMPTEEYSRAVDLPAVKGSSLPAGRAVKSGEMRALFDVCAEDPGAIGARDAALLAVMYGAGLRRSEVVSLDVADFNAETGALTVRKGKGNKARTTYASGGTREAIAAWLEWRGETDGPLFTPVLKSGRVVHRRLTDQTVLDALMKRARQAGIDDVSPHDFRRTFIGDLLDQGADISTVQQLAGHANVTTTARYDRRGERAKQKAAELLHVPFRRQRGTVDE